MRQGLQQLEAAVRARPAPAAAAAPAAALAVAPTRWRPSLQAAVHARAGSGARAPDAGGRLQAAAARGDRLPVRAGSDECDKNTTIRKWCHHFFSSTGCERGAYCTFAHGSDDFGKTWFNRDDNFKNFYKSVLCKFHQKSLQTNVGVPLMENC